WIATMLGARVVPSDECSDHVRTVLGMGVRTHKPSGKRIAIGCGCSDLSEARKLSPAQWSQHVFCPAKGVEVVFLGNNSDRNEAEKIIATVQVSGSPWSGKLVNLCGTLSLQDSLRVLAECDEFWGIDSALLHYARLFGLRIKAFLGPTHPLRLRPI